VAILPERRGEVKLLRLTLLLFYENVPP
jgi:hypothetical protein